MPSRREMVIDLGRRRFRALAATHGKTGWKITHSLLADLPESIALGDAAATGQWLGEQLKRSKFPGGRVVVSLGREHAVVKRISLPTAEASELPEMTRLAMQRELPFDAGTAVIDFLPVERLAASTIVLAMAVAQSAVDHARQVMRAAGWAIHSITLRTMGPAALLATKVGLADKGGNGLVIDLTGESIEFCVIVDNTIRFSRAAEIALGGSAPEALESVVTECRRTWMSYRTAEDSVEVSSAVLLGNPSLAREVSVATSEALKILVEMLRGHPSIDAGNHDLDQLWPLAGLLLDPVTGDETIDFNAPRKAPDVAGQSRKRRLLAAAVLLIVALGGWTLARRDLGTLETQAARLKQKQDNLLPEYAKFWRQSYRVEHLKQWERSGVDWLKHASYLATMAPPPDKVVLDSWVGSLDFRGVNYDKKTGRWSIDQQMTIVIDGEARDRTTADAFREALTKNPVYSTSTTGADAMGGKRLPFGFTYRLRTRDQAPVEQSPAPAKTSADSEKAPPALATGNAPAVTEGGSP